MCIVYLLFSTPMNIVSLREKKGTSILPPFTHPYLVKEFAKKESGICGFDMALLLCCVGSITIEKISLSFGLKMYTHCNEMNL